jgi:mannobiose 2-epimerase
MQSQFLHSGNGSALENLRTEARHELDRILAFWSAFSLDPCSGKFIGKLDDKNKPVPGSPRGSVLYSRMLWTFSAAHSLTRDPAQLALAARLYHDIRDHFTDISCGGIYWTVDANGHPLDTHKQIYAMAFGIYGMSEYYRASGHRDALDLAIEWFKLIEKYSLDTGFGGYTNAFTRNWSFLKDKRLSPKDDHAVKTTNTHLHLVEAYANLYEVWPNDLLRIRIMDLLLLFRKKMLDKNSGHLHLFFDEQWKPSSDMVSYGHDIEAAWLLQSCAISAGDQMAINLSKAEALRMTNAALEGMDIDGGLWHERNIKTGEWVREKHWWPQAEALIGLCNAWQLSGDEKYQTALLKNWRFIKKYIMDKKNGEWFWGVQADHAVIPEQDKIGLWKCPYHNGRACLQLIRRLNSDH